MADWWHNFKGKTELSPNLQAVSGSNEIRILGTTIKLHRTLRVPDDGKKHSLPPVRCGAAVGRFAAGR